MSKQKRNLSLSAESLAAIKDMVQWMVSCKQDEDVLMAIDWLMPAHYAEASKLLTVCYGQQGPWHKNIRVRSAMERIKTDGGKDYNRLFWTLRPPVPTS